ASGTGGGRREPFGCSREDRCRHQLCARRGPRRCPERGGHPGADGGGVPKLFSACRSDGRVSAAGGAQPRFLDRRNGHRQRPLESSQPRSVRTGYVAKLDRPLNGGLPTYVSVVAGLVRRHREQSAAQERSGWPERQTRKKMNKSEGPLRLIRENANGPCI